MPRTVLVVEDETKIRELVRGSFERAGFRVIATGSGRTALELERLRRPDLMVLDLRLPDVPGERVAAEVRRRSTTPILMLTAKAGEQDRIRGLELGADDYVTKPFSPRELVLRAEAIMRRAGGDAPGPRSFDEARLLIDDERREVRSDGRPVELTRTEFDVLAALAAVPGRVYTRRELLERAGGERMGSERAVDSHVKNLRAKLEPDRDTPRVVETVLGVGYRLGLRRDA